MITCRDIADLERISVKSELKSLQAELQAKPINASLRLIGSIVVFIR